MTKKTPLELQLEKQVKGLDKIRKMDKELSKYGRKVPSGMMWTVGDMQRFFKRKKK